MELALATGHLDLGAGTLCAPDGEVRQLTTQERAILGYLAERPHEDVSRDVLQAEVLGYAETVHSRAVDHTIKRIRAKVEPVPARPVHVVSVRGTGYRFVPLASEGSRPLALWDRVVDLDRLEVRRADAPPVPLSATEGRLLEVLIAHEGRPVGQEELLRAVWGVYDRRRKRVVDKAVYRMRAKLEANPREPVHLRTVRGKGLVLEGTRPLEGPAAPAAPGDADEVDVPWVCPPPIRPVVGRSDDRRRVLAALEPEGAWVTLVGAGGVGKSALARWVGSEWAHAASWTDLAGVTTEQGVLEAMSAAHGVDVPSDGSEGPLVDTLVHAPDVLMVVDNAEGVSDALAVELARVARGLPRRPRILVTSRHPLRLPEEHVVTLAPLPPESARELFSRCAERAGASAADDDTLTEVVERLGGIPLAIELAAARVPLLGLSGVAERLHQPLRLLRARSPADPRHGSMESVWELTWQDLPDSARRALAASAAFVGSFRLEALEYVLAGLSNDDPLDSIQELTDRMLLERRPNGRLQLLVAVSDFVTERAADSETSTWARLRALEWVAQLAGDVVPGVEPTPLRCAMLLPDLEGALALVREGLARRWWEPVVRCLCWALPLLSRQGWRQRAIAWGESGVDLDELDPGLRRAFVWRVADLLVLAGRRTDAAALVAEHFRPDDPLTVAFELRAAETWSDARLAEARALLEGVDGALGVVLCRGLAYAHEQQGRIEDTLQLHRRALRLAEAADLPWQVSDARRWLGASLRDLGQADEARPHFEQVVEIREQAGLPVPTSYYGSMAGILGLQGRLDEEIATLREGVAAARHRGDLVVGGWSEHILGTCLARRGELDAAAEWFRRARATYERLGDRAGAAIALANLGEALRQCGHVAEARRAWDEALAAAHGLGNPRVASMVLLSRGRLELAQGELDAAKATIEAALTHSQGTDLLMYQVANEVVYADVLAHLGDAGALQRARGASERARAAYRNDVLVQVLCHHASAAHALGELEEARRLFHEARALAQELSLKRTAGGRQMVAELAERLGEPPRGQGTR